MGLRWGPPPCGICGKTANCKCAAAASKKKAEAAKKKPETKRGTTQVKTARGTVISHTATVKTGNVVKNGNSWCGKCGSRIIDGKHSGLCQ